MEILSGKNEPLKGALLTNLNHSKTKGQDGQASHLQVLDCKWQTDDRKGEKSCQEKMHQCQFKTGQNDPNNVHDDGNSTTGWLCLANFVTEGCHPQYGELETLNSEGNTNNCDTQQDATQDIGEGDKKPAEDKPENIEQK